MGRGGGVEGVEGEEEAGAEGAGEEGEEEAGVEETGVEEQRKRWRWGQRRQGLEGAEEQREQGPMGRWG